jgi:hypothetical protein
MANFIFLLVLAIDLTSYGNQPFMGRNFNSFDGIYALVGIGQLRELPNILHAPGIAGVSLNAEWIEIEPKEGSYRWTSLDEQIKTADKAGKRVLLRLFPGISTPEWVYAKGAKPFEFIDKNPSHGAVFYAPGHRFSTYGKNLKMPVPWDEIFLTSWERFVEAAGSHYQDATNIAMVHITGPTRHSAEMHLPKEKEVQEKWRALGYTPQKLIGAWKRSIDAFARAFPHTALVLNLSPVIFDDGVMEAVARYGYETYGRRFFMQNNILLAQNKEMKRKDWSVLQEYSTKTTIGFQRGLLKLKAKGNLSPSEQLRIRRANFEGMLAQGLALGAKYFEVGAAEVRDFPEVVKDTAERLERLKK